MFDKEQKKRVLLAFIATLALVNGYIFSKTALSEVHLFELGFY